MAERITRSHPIGLGIFWSICTNKFEIWNLCVKNIIFACSLPMSTSTWRSDHRNRPGGYMSGELKSEKYKILKSPHSKKQSSRKKTHNYPIIYNQVLERYSYFIFDYFTILERSSKPTRLYNQDPPQSTRPSQIAVYT
jgi:hypothetical protein